MNPARLPTIVLTDEVLPGEAAEMARILLEAKTRHTDPQTSHDAAASVLNMTENRIAVLSTFMLQGPMTHFELVAKYPLGGYVGQSESGLRTRTSELVRMGKLVDTGVTRKNKFGRECVVWGIP